MRIKEKIKLNVAQFICDPIGYLATRKLNLCDSETLAVVLSNLIAQEDEDINDILKSLATIYVENTKKTFKNNSDKLLYLITKILYNKKVDRKVAEKSIIICIDFMEILINDSELISSMRNDVKKYLYKVYGGLDD